MSVNFHAALWKKILLQAQGDGVPSIPPPPFGEILDLPPTDFYKVIISDFKTVLGKSLKIYIKTKPYLHTNYQGLICISIEGLQHFKLCPKVETDPGFPSARFICRLHIRRIR